MSLQKVNSITMRHNDISSEKTRDYNSNRIFLNDKKIFF
jgi:hypothetical protein